MTSRVTLNSLPTSPTCWCGRARRRKWWVGWRILGERRVALSDESRARYCATVDDATTHSHSEAAASNTSMSTSEGMKVKTRYKVSGWVSNRLNHVRETTLLLLTRQTKSLEMCLNKRKLDPDSDLSQTNVIRIRIRFALAPNSEGLWFGGQIFARTSVALHLHYPTTLDAQISSWSYKARHFVTDTSAYHCSFYIFIYVYFIAFNDFILYIYMYLYNLQFPCFILCMISNGFKLQPSQNFGASDQ